MFKVYNILILLCRIDYMQKRHLESCKLGLWQLKHDDNNQIQGSCNRQLINHLKPFLK